MDGGEVSELLEEQTRYYRAFAATYDLNAEWESKQAETRESVASVYEWVAELPIAGNVLELGCGTGLWTQRLASRAEHVHAVDIAPEMIERAEARLAGAGNVTFELADLYRWQPAGTHDVVFFSFLLSHVPPHLAPTFWNLVSSSLADAGVAAFVDDAPTRRDVEEWVGDGVVRRTLHDGSHYRIVKVLPTPEELIDSISAQGLHANVKVVGDTFLAGAARHVSTSGSGIM